MTTFDHYTGHEVVKFGGFYFFQNLWAKTILTISDMFIFKQIHFYHVVNHAVILKGVVFTIFKLKIMIYSVAIYYFLTYLKPLAGAISIFSIPEERKSMKTKMCKTHEIVNAGVPVLCVITCLYKIYRLSFIPQGNCKTKNFTSPQVPKIFQNFFEIWDLVKMRNPRNSAHWRSSFLHGYLSI